MFGPGTHHTIAVQLINRVITQGRQLLCDKGMVVGYKDKAGNLTGFAVYQEGGPALLYSGTDPDKAASCYVSLVGPLVAIGDAVKFFRAQQNVVVDV